MQLVEPVHTVAAIQDKAVATACIGILWVFPIYPGFPWPTSAGHAGDQGVLAGCYDATYIPGGAFAHLRGLG
jgi:hypothetical protein